MNSFMSRRLQAIKFIDFSGCTTEEAIKKCKDYIKKYDRPFNQLEPWQYHRLRQVEGALGLLTL